MDGFEEIKELVLHYVRGIWRKRWIAIIIAWPVMIGGVLMVDQLKDRYKADTKVYIDTTSVLKPLLKGLAIQSDIQSNVQLMVRKLLSRPNLERAIRLMDLDIDVESNQDLELLINKVRDRVSIQTKRRTNTYTISYSDEDPVQAKRMVQTLLDIFVEDTLGKSVKESDSAISFLDKQIVKYDKLLQEAEERLESFKRKNVGFMPKDGANYYSQLENVNNSLQDANLILAESINRRDKLKSQIVEINEFNEKASVPENFVSTYQERINEQEVMLDNLLLSYTEEHPEVQNARRVLGSLLNKKKEEVDNIDSSQPGVDKFKNPIFQELQIKLSETEAYISSINARVSLFEKKKKSLQELVDVIPRIEAELKRLNRDYGVHKQNYGQLVTRREQAKISDDVESGTEQVKFRIIEPPHVPTKPDYPNRVLFDMAALFFALGIGYGVGLLLSMAQPVISNSNELRKLTDLPVLGAVSKFDTSEVLFQRKRNLFLYIVANIAFFSMALIFLVLHMKGILIVSSFKQIILGL